MGIPKKHQVQKSAKVVLAAVRKYGVYLLLVPIAVFWLDDYLTAWHHQGHDGIRRILIENLIEDGIIAFVAFAFGRWYAAQRRGIHCECPNCHFRWIMHPRQKQPFCPHCGAAEPSGR
jgi:hypothetical protein